ncbi:MAG: UTP--glucose-1-phosphate uridylyltransferase [Oligoflexia bacterium]|nr:UTP--glucose-1-phosphate uridylyltransferase [Oligoflexia bacterium]
MKIKTAVIPVAGKGTRFHPVTKVVPKELLPLVDTPILHFIVKEAALAGIERIVLITSKGKTGLVDYFDSQRDDPIFQNLSFIAVRQGDALGLGHAILCARPIVQNEPFAVLLGDDVIDGKVSATKQLIDISEKYSGAPVVGIMNVSDEDVSKYGIIEGTPIDKKTFAVKSLIEKPDLKNAPSNLAIPGRYVLTPDIFDILKDAQPGLKGEIQLTDSLNVLAKNREMYAYEFEGRRFDAGDKFGYLEANLHYGLQRKEMAEKIKSLLASLGD